MEAQMNWRRCTACQAFVNTTGSGGSCLAGGVHQFMGTGEYLALWGPTPEGAHEGFASCEKCGAMYLRHIVGRCTDQGDHLFSEFSPSYSLMVGSTVARAEPGWRPCTGCQVVADTRRPGLCVVSGGQHDFSGNFEYSVLVRETGFQRGWYWCNRCQGLVASTNFTNSCFDGTPHVSDGTEFSLTFGATPPGAQEAWRLCVHCLALVYAGTSTGACFVGQQHAFGDLAYSLPIGEPPVSAQPGWRHCGKCQVIAYGNFTPGPCAAGDVHDHSASATYSIWPQTLAHGQPGWRRCRKCNAMTMSMISTGVCRDHGPHDLTGSAAYCMQIGAEIGSESSWSWCTRCQSLVSGGPSVTGVCHDGAPHAITESWAYSVPVEEFPEGSEAGWRRCGACQVLAFNGSGVPDGQCHGGVPHNFAGSADYHVPVDPGLTEAPVVTGPRLSISETSESLSLAGEGFTASVPVELSFIHGTTTTKRTVTTDASGGFLHVETPVTAAAGGGLVLAEEEGGATASGRTNDFVPTPADPAAPSG